MSDFLELTQTLQMGIKSLLMYTAAHPRAKASLDNLTVLIEAWLRENPTLHIATSNGKMFVDGNPFEGQSIHLTNTARMLTERQISGIIFSRGLAPEEVGALMELLILKPARIEERGGAAKILEEMKLEHVQLGQVQYREVREGEGGQEDHGGPASRPVTLPETAPASAAKAGQGASSQGSASHAPSPEETLQALAGEWEREFKKLPQPDAEGPESGGESGTLDLSFLGGSLACLGLGDGFPTAQQMEALRKALMALPAGTLLTVVESLDSLPQAPAGLRMAFQALAPEIFGHAAAELMEGGAGQGEGWGPMKDRLHRILQGSPSFQSLLAGLEGELRKRGMGLENLQELVSRLDWDTLGVDEQLRLVEERQHLWKLSHDQRLAFLKKILDGGRIEAFAAILDQILKSLAVEDASRREAAARTLTGVAHWIASPGIPVECEGPFLQGLAAHFGWESYPQIHRATTEALGVAVARMVERGEPGQAQAVIQELEGLCAFLENQEPWRSEALTWLHGRLAQPESLGKVLELLHTANPETLLTELIPYLEAVGEPAARKLVEVLGEEQDRKRRSRLMEVIRGLGGMAMPAVLESLASPKWYLVRNTLNLVADMGDLEAFQPAQECLAHADGRVRRAAVRAMWKLGGAASVAPLMDAFGKADPETLLEIMFAFGQIRSNEVIPLLAQFAMERRMPVKLRERAVETLGLIGDPVAIPYLEEILRRKGRFITSAEPTELRLAACRGLVALGTPQAMAALRNLVAQEPRNSDRPLLQHFVAQNQP